MADIFDDIVSELGTHTKLPAARKAIVKKARTPSSRRLKSRRVPKPKGDGSHYDKAGKNYTGILIAPDGAQEYKRGFKLKDMQNMVGGHIESVSITPQVVNGVYVDTAIVNEEGALKGLPFNKSGSSYYYEGSHLRGPVLLTCGTYI
jgi:hypothetical protein